MPLYGGTAGHFPVLAFRQQPPARVYRIIPGQVWWTLVYWPWRQYLAAVATGSATATPPHLSHPGAAGVYITDRASLAGCVSPSDFAGRLALNAQAQQECQLYGCAAIRFDLPNPYALLPAPFLPGTISGFTGGGAREWILAGSVALSATMQVHYIERTATGSRYFRLPL